MKRFLSTILILCLVFVGVTFAGCGNGGGDEINIPSPLDGMPENSDIVLGNGGLTIQKGDYVYFASGFVDAEKLGKTFSNINGSVTNGGLYRAKLEELSAEKEGTIVTVKEITQPELMVSKVVGFKDGGLYIFKDKIYFSSPSIARDSSGVRYDLLTFYSCNLDGSNLKEFYQTKKWVKDTSSFTMTMINEKVYLLISHKNEVLRINEEGKEFILVSESKEAILPKRETVVHLDEDPNINEQFIYFTKDTDSESPISLGQTLFKVEIATGNKTELFKDIENKVQLNLLEIKANRIFYARTSKDSGDTFAYYSNSLEGSVFLNSETQHSYNTLTSPVSLGEKEGNNLGFVFTDSTKVTYTDTEGKTQTKTVYKIYFKPLNSTYEAVELVSSSSSLSILGVYDGYVYYMEGSYTYRIDSIKSDAKSQSVSGTDLKLLKTFCDIDMNFCYLFVEDANAASGYSIYAVSLNGLKEEVSKPQKLVELDEDELEEEEETE